MQKPEHELEKTKKRVKNFNIAMIVIMVLYLIGNIFAFIYENVGIRLARKTWIMILPAVIGTIVNSSKFIGAVKLEDVNELVSEFQYLISSRQMSFVLCDIGFIIMGVLVIVFGENYRKCPQSIPA